MAETKNNKVILFIIVLLALLVGVIIFRKEYLLKDYSLTSGKIIHIRQAYKGGLDIEYEYFVGNKKYKSGGYISSPYYNKDKFFGKVFHVVYSITDNSISNILITPYMYEKHNIDYPDSLKWVVPLLN